MAKIHAYPPMTSPDGQDVIPIDDQSASWATKSISLTKLKEWFQSLAGWITSSMITYVQQTQDISGSTTSGTFVNVSTPLVVTVPASGRLLIELSATLSDTATGTALSVALSGANTITEADVRVPYFAATGSVLTQAASSSRLLTGLTPGSTTIQARIRRFGAGSGTSTLSNGRITATQL